MRVKKILLIPVYLFIFLVAWAGLAWILANNLIIEKPLPKADALLVLSGSAAYIERTHEAAIIFKQGIAPKIFLTNDGLQSGWDQNEQRNPYFVERARWELIQQGIPEEAIEILPTIVSGTNDEANLLAQLANNRKLNSLLLVTSAYHSRRTFWTFERAMLRKNLDLQIGVVSSPTGQQILRQNNWWLSSQGWKTVGVEYVKIAYYWLYY